MTDNSNCLACRGRGYINASDTPGGPTRQIACGDCVGTGMK